MAAVGAKPVDMELKKAFQELQMKAVQTAHQIKVADAQIDTLKKQIVHSTLVTQEIDAIPDDTRMFDGVGRMFILQPVSVVKENVEKKRNAAEQKIKTIETSKAYLEKSIKESEHSLRELVTSRQIGKAS